jgi:hypothetical protein
VLSFSMLFIVLAVALIPGTMGFAKAAQDGETGTTADADFYVLIRDNIMVILGIALSTIQLVRSPRKGSAYAMAWAFSGLVVLLGVTAVVLYPLVNKAYSSLCGFFAQFFAFASLTILVLDETPEIGKSMAWKIGVEGGVTSEDKKDQ